MSNITPKAIGDTAIWKNDASSPAPTHSWYFLENMNCIEKRKVAIAIKKYSKTIFLS